MINNSTLNLCNLLRLEFAKTFKKCYGEKSGSTQDKHYGREFCKKRINEALRKEIKERKND